MRIGMLMFAATLLGGCEFQTNERLDVLENRVDYVYEIIRQRKVSAEHCEVYSDTQMSCSLNPKGRCQCIFKPDAQDIENQLFDDAVAKRAAAIVAEAAEPADSPEE